MAVFTLKVPIMLTINETVEYLDKKAQEDGAKNRITKHYLRQLALKNQIVHKRAGNKILINLDKLIEFLNSDDVFEADVKNSNCTNKFGIVPVCIK